jgi:hypothetical protein
MAVTHRTHAALGRSKPALMSLAKRLFYTRIENDRGDRNDIVGEGAMTNRILGYEPQQRRVAKIVCTIENDALTSQILMLFQMSSRTCGIPASRNRRPGFHRDGFGAQFRGLCPAFLLQHFHFWCLQIDRTQRGFSSRKDALRCPVLFRVEVKML